MDARDDEVELLDQARRGNAAAFGDLARLHSTVALRVAYVICGSMADAEDALQEGLMKAYRALDGFRAESPLRPWLVRIVANEARNRRRSTARRGHLAERAATAASSAADAAPAEVDALNRLQADALVAGLDRLDERDRAVIALRYFGGLSEAEMAVALDCAPGTVKSRLSRALARLRPFVESEVRDG